jgi:hypothetical protein
LPGCLTVRLYVTPQEARRRARTRKVYLTDAEFENLHTQDRNNPPSADYHLDVTVFEDEEQAAAVFTIWMGAS